MTDFKKLAADAVAAKKIKTAYEIVTEYHRVNSVEFDPIEFYPNKVETYETRWGLCVEFSNNGLNYAAKYIIK